MLCSLLCYKVPSAKHSGGVLNVTKVTIISHLITISYTDLFSGKYETSLFKSDAGFKAVSELKEILLLLRLCCAYWTSIAVSSTVKSLQVHLVPGWGLCKRLPISCVFNC